MSEPLYYTSSSGKKKLIDEMHPAHAHAAANLEERKGDGHDAGLVSALRASADRRAKEWEAAYEAEHGVPYVKKADRT
jgi:hypothetical protein